jgi:uncharacterized membrane protein (UPF0127 family)
MSKNYKTYLVIVAVLIVVGVFCWAIFVYLSMNRTKQKSPPSPCGNYSERFVEIGGKNIKMDISDTDCKRELGLSGRKSLLDGTGMIFVFEKNGNYGFWMKEMKFSIDMVWVESDLTVNGIEKSAAPETFPKIFGQEYLAKYVLELPAGFSEKNSVVVGNKIKILEK